MTTKEREDRFIEKCRVHFGTLSWEGELLLRYGFAAGAAELRDVAYVEGVEAQQAAVLAALGAACQPKERLP